MSAPPAPLRMVEFSGAESLCLLEVGTPGRLVYAQRDLTVVRPGRYTREFGRPVVRTPAPTAAAPAVDVITGPQEAALPHCFKGMGDASIQRTLAGWAHGRHDPLTCLRPKTVSGFHLTRAEA